ncbi:MAG: hypothetical protein ABL997_08865 [Planctomycetota bacterium]
MHQAIRFLCACLIAIAVGFLVYSMSVDPKDYRAPAGIDLIGTPAECSAWGWGMLVGGLLLLMLFGGSPKGFDKPGKP